MELENISSAASVSSPRLPFLVLELLFEYLDFFTLQALRLVCKTTKSRVETREVLRHFHVRITGKDRLNEVLRAADHISWNSFLFTEKCSSISEADVQRFLAAYGDKARELTFNWTENSELQIRLLSGCPHLESLTADELNSNLISNELANQLLENWKELRHFLVEHFNGSPSAEPAGPQPFFSRLLSSCTHLETVRVPCFKVEDFPGHITNYSNHKGGTYERLVLSPLLDTIGLGRLRSVVVSSVYDDEQFWRLALACVESGTVLYGNGVRHTRIPEHLPSLMDIIGDLDTITDVIIRQPLTNVRSIYLDGSMFLTFKDRAYTMPPFPYLISVNLNFDVSILEEVYKRRSSKTMDLFVLHLTQEQRPTVQRLSIWYPHTQVESPINISPVDLCSSFVNLRVLLVDHWQGEDEEWLKLWPLVGHTLVELDLLNCPNLSDRGILGDDPNQPAFLQLKHLRSLWLHNVLPVNNRKITETSFIDGFRHMRLRSFHFEEDWDDESRGKKHSHVSSSTLKAMWSGAFGETIESFVVQKMDLMPQRPRGNHNTGAVGDGNRSQGKRRMSQCSIN